MAVGYTFTHARTHTYLQVDLDDPRGFTSRQVALVGACPRARGNKTDKDIKQLNMVRRRQQLASTSEKEQHCGAEHVRKPRTCHALRLFELWRQPTELGDQGLMIQEGSKQAGRQLSVASQKRYGAPMRREQNTTSVPAGQENDQHWQQRRNSSHGKLARHSRQHNLQAAHSRGHRRATDGPG